MAGAINRVFMVVDGHPTHKSKLVREFVDSQAVKLQQFFLLPYSPQLNLDEQVWAHVKRPVKSKFVENKDEIKRLALGAALHRIQKLPALVKSFFNHNECLDAQM